MEMVTAPNTVDPVEVLGLGAAGTLSWVVEQRRRQDAAAAEEMRAVTHWADQHRVESWVEGAIHPDVYRSSTDAELGRESFLRLAGEGAFMVAEFAVAELAAALRLSEGAARAYVGQSVELRDRLPRCWARVIAGDLTAWKARRIAEETIPLTAATADWVDAQLAPFADRISLTRILRAVAAAVLRFEPDLADQRARSAAEKRGVWLEDRLDGTTSVTAVAGTPEAATFDRTLNDIADALGALGDVDPHGVRRAKAVGVLADPQYALDLTSADAAVRSQARPSGGPSIHVHLHTAAVSGPVALSVGLSSALAVGPVARVDGYGPRALESVRQWLGDLAPGASVKVTPVVDLTERISVDAYEIPQRLHDQVTERDPCCQFPWCGRRGRFDVDHIDEYLPPERGGPPGQTNSSNLARLCRFHHRVKTHSEWTYRREPSGGLVWTSPFGRCYAVDHTGTYPQ